MTENIDNTFENLCNKFVSEKDKKFRLEIHKAVNWPKYSYLNEQESELYDLVLESNDPKDLIIKKLLENNARASGFLHSTSNY